MQRLQLSPQTREEGVFFVLRVSFVLEREFADHIPPQEGGQVQHTHPLRGLVVEQQQHLIQ